MRIHSAISYQLSAVSHFLGAQKRERSAIIGTLCFFTFAFCLLLPLPSIAEEDYGTQEFMNAAQSDDAKITRDYVKSAIVKMTEGIRAGKEEAVNRAVESRAAIIGNLEIRALLFFTLSEAYEENNRIDKALFYLDKAISNTTNIKRKSFYEKKKEKLMKRAG